MPGLGLGTGLPGAATVKVKGYIRGLVGLLITPLDRDAGPLPDEPMWVDTASVAEVDIEKVAGEREALRGGDRVLAFVEEDDTWVGASLKVTDARYHPYTQLVVMGGTLLVTGTDITGWEAPSIADQAAGQPRFRVEIYARSRSSRGTVDGVKKVTLFYCRGVLKGVKYGDRTWAAPEFEISASPNPADGRWLAVEYVGESDIPTGPTHDDAA